MCRIQQDATLVYRSSQFEYALCEAHPQYFAEISSNSLHQVGLVYVIPSFII